MKNLFALLAIYVALSMPVFSQVKVTGKVEDADLHSPLKGATVRITGSYTTAYSDAEGNFVLTNLKIAKQSLEISYIGYETKKLEFVAHKDTSVVLLLKKKTVLADEIEIKAVRAGENDPMTSDKMDSKQIAEKNMGQDITYIMGLTPSAVVTSDAGTGVGYTGIRIRGTDPTRINVTINGIPVNDAESQGTYWVDLPDIASLVDNMQIQRGVGTSTNGAGAFGASLARR